MMQVEQDGHGAYVLFASTKLMLAAQSTEVLASLPPCAVVEDYKRIGDEVWRPIEAVLAGLVSTSAQCRRVKADIRLSTRELLGGGILESVESGLLVLLPRPCPDTLIVRNLDAGSRVAALRNFKPWLVVAIASSGVGDEVRYASSERSILEQLITISSP